MLLSIVCHKLYRIILCVLILCWYEIWFFILLLEISPLFLSVYDFWLRSLFSRIGHFFDYGWIAITFLNLLSLIKNISNVFLLLIEFFEFYFYLFNLYFLNWIVDLGMLDFLNFLYRYRFLPSWPSNAMIFCRQYIYTYIK